MWGVNAENGVINIITKKSADTTGGQLYGAVGDREFYEGVLHLGAAKGPVALRGTAGAYHDNGFGRGSGDNTKDFYEAYQVTGRVDYNINERNDLIIGGGHKNNTIGAAIPQNDTVQYMNLLWERKLTDTSDLLLRWSENFYINNNMPSHELHTRKDMVEVQHSMRFDAHNFVWGADYIKDSYETRLGTLVDFANPDSFSNDQGSLFAEDEMTLAKNVWFTLGGRVHYNELSQFDWAARGALTWAVRPKHFLRAALSRSFRRPIMYETFPNKYNAPGTKVVLRDNTSLGNERVVTSELGYRSQFTDNLSLDIVGFYSWYSHLIGAVGDQYQNTHYMTTYGFETALDYKPYKWWLLRAGYSFENQSKDDELNDRVYGRLSVWLPPKHKVFMTNRFYFDETTTLNTKIFWSDALNSRLGNSVNQIAPYLRFDIRLAKKLWSESTEIAVGITNLTEHFHNELNNTADEVPRQLYVQLFYNF
ncbi:TonB-dependent receptor plug domain-containing protein [Planctomycetota bacterium]